MSKIIKKVYVARAGYDPGSMIDSPDLFIGSYEECAKYVDSYFDGYIINGKGGIQAIQSIQALPKILLIQPC